MTVAGFPVLLTFSSRVFSHVTFRVCMICNGEHWKTLLCTIRDSLEVMTDDGPTDLRIRRISQ